MNIKSQVFEFALDRCVVFDLETYPGRWMCGFSWESKGETKHTIVDGDVEKLEKVLGWFGKKDKILCGYNSAAFDSLMLRGILEGWDAFELCGRLIMPDDLDEVAKTVWKSQRKEFWSEIRGWLRLGVDHIDLAMRLSKNGRIPSLKMVAASLHRPILRDLPFPPGKVLTDAEWSEVIDYNKVDLSHTAAYLPIAAPEIEAMTWLSNEFGIDLRSVPKSKSACKIFEKIYRDDTGREPPAPVVPEFATYRPPPGVYRPKTSAAAEWFDSVADRSFPMFLDRKGRPKPLVPKLNFKLGNLSFNVKKGGLHSIDKPIFLREDDEWALWSVDVSSYYPELIRKKGIFPEAYGSIGHEAYANILDRRQTMKKEKDALESKLFALKIVLNALSGQFGYEHSSLYDPSAYLAITISGQLMLVDLVERLLEIDVAVISVNTDGVFFKVQRGDDRFADVLARWEADTEMKLDRDPLECILVLATNMIATRNKKGKVKRKGAPFLGTLDADKTANAFVINDAIVSAFFDKTLPEVSIGREVDLKRFCYVTRCTRAVREGVAIDGAGVETPLPKVARWYKTAGPGLRLQHRLKSGKVTTPAGAKTGVGLAMDIPGLGIPDDLDWAWYIAKAREKYDKVPGPHRVDPSFLDDERAKHVADLGLVPYPKRGKLLLKWQGIQDVSLHPSYFHPWSSYDTFGAITGPAVGILVVDVDVVEKWAKVVTGAGKMLDGCLVAWHVEASPEEVRSASARGKLIFKFEATWDHPLAKIAINKLKPKCGIEIFYGKGIPSVLGHHPDGSSYRLDGVLGPVPEWLLDLLIIAAEKDVASKKAAAEKGAAKRAAARAAGVIPDPDAVGAYGAAALNSAAAAVAHAPDGERNGQAFKESAGIGELVAAGALSREEAETTLVEAAKESGLDEEEAERVVANGLNRGEENPRDLSHVGRQARADRDEYVVPPDEHLAQIHQTEMGNGARLVARFGDHLRYVPDWTKWLVWNSQRWQLDTDNAGVQRLAKEMAKAIFKEAATFDELEKQKRHIKWAFSSQTRAVLVNSVYLARTELLVSHEDLDRCPYLFNVPNGTVDLRTGELLSHDRDDRITQISPTLFDKDATCPRFLKFLNEIFAGDHREELVNFTRRWFGYSLTGDCREQKMPIWHGEGSNGKSTLINVLLEILGIDYSMQAAKDLLINRKHPEHPTTVARLFRKRLVAIVETDMSHRMDVSQFKLLTGGDRIAARRMREDEWEFDPTHKLIMATNSPPSIPDGGVAEFRRILSVPFKVIFPADKVDSQLPEKLRNESPGILAWAVRGCLEWQRDGLNPPEIIKITTEEYRADQDTLEPFLVEKCNRDPGNEKLQIQSSRLHAAYCVWCKEHGQHPMNPNKFSAAMAKKGFVVRKSGVNWFHGIDLRPWDGKIRN